MTVCLDPETLYEAVLMIIYSIVGKETSTKYDKKSGDNINFKTFKFIF